jgi:hypothetical protein
MAASTTLRPRAVNRAVRSLKRVRAAGIASSSRTFGGLAANRRIPPDCRLSGHHGRLHSQRQPDGSRYDRYILRRFAGDAARPALPTQGLAAPAACAWIDHLRAHRDSRLSGHAWSPRTAGQLTSIDSCSAVLLLIGPACSPFAFCSFPYPSCRLCLPWRHPSLLAVVVRVTLRPRPALSSSRSSMSNRFPA